MVAGWLFRVRSSRTRFPKLRGRRRGGAAAAAVSSGSQRRAHGRIVAAMHCLSRPAILRLSRATAGMARSAAHSWALQRCCRSSQICSAVRAGCSTLQGLQATMRAAAMLALPPPGPPNSTLTCSLQLENKRGRARGRRVVKGAARATTRESTLHVAGRRPLNAPPAYASQPNCVLVCPGPRAGLPACSAFRARRCPLPQPPSSLTE